MARLTRKVLEREHMAAAVALLQAQAAGDDNRVTAYRYYYDRTGVLLDYLDDKLVDLPSIE